MLPSPSPGRTATRPASTASTSCARSAPAPPAPAKSSERSSTVPKPAGSRRSGHALEPQPVLEVARSVEVEEQVGRLAAAPQPLPFQEADPQAGGLGETVRGGDAALDGGRQRGERRGPVEGAERLETALPPRAPPRRKEFE